jgi:osmotically-inducible protein OsmY
MRANKIAAAIFVTLLSLSISAIAKDAAAPSNDVTARFADGGFNISGLRAVEVGGIVVLRGKTIDPAEVVRVAEYARNLGYQRVANVVAIAEAPDDEMIERRAERALASRSLDGCSFHIDSQQGVVHVAGRVQFELQKDIVVGLIRGIDGVREVKMELVR